jgi:hypothetical protein
LDDNVALELPMVQAPITLTVSPAEFRMLATLRQMPESPLLEELLAFARNPRCDAFQADGTPCAEPQADCDQCQVVNAMLDRLNQSWPLDRPDQQRP